MDIQKWLDETAEPEGPPLANAPQSNPFDEVDKPKPVLKERRAAKHPESDSSILVPQTYSRREPRRQQILLTEERSSVSAHSKAPRSSRGHSTESESSTQRYARKPRRKTRQERYQPKPTRELREHVHQSRKHESKKPRRKPRRKKGEKPGSGLAQSFQAKNVASDRLTLKPREQLGLFNKGKTSTMVRGRGLPDLVFSEMKFLQKDKRQPDSVPQQEAPTKKSKRDHRHSKEGEISAFFTSTRPVLVERDGNIQAKDAQSGADITATANHRKRRRSPKPSGVLPTVELPDTGSYLGFGSRGPRHESTSYVSWSDSVRAPETHQDPKHTPQVTQCGPLKQREKPKRAGEITESSLPPVARHGIRESVARFQVSSEGPSHQRVCRSNSYPQHSSSPRKASLVDRTAKTHLASVASRSSMPPFAPIRVSAEPQNHQLLINSMPAKSNKTVSTHADNAFTRRRIDIDNRDDMADAELRLSSDWGEILQQCNRTFHARHRATAPARRHAVLLDMNHNDDEAYGNARLDLNRTSQRIPTVHFVESDMPSPAIPNFIGSSIYEEQARRQHLPRQDVCEDQDPSYDPYLGQEFVVHPHAVLDVAPEWDGYLEEPMLYGGGDCGVDEQDTLEDGVQRLASDNSVVAPGFWRPNRLY